MREFKNAKDNQLGIPLPKGADGLVNAGIGPGLSTGTTSLIPPTKEIGADPGAAGAVHGRAARTVVRG